MIARRSPDDFLSALYGGRHTVEVLARWLEGIPKDRQAALLLSVFSDAGRPRSAFRSQTLAGKLLVLSQPVCALPLEAVLRPCLPTWNISVEQLPFYLGRAFGAGTVVQLARDLKVEFEEDSREAEALRAVIWWLRGGAR